MFKTTLSSQPLLTYSDNPSIYILSTLPTLFVLQFFFVVAHFFFSSVFYFLKCVCLFLWFFFFWSHTIILNAHFKSCHTNSNSIGKEEGSSSTRGMDFFFEVPSSYYPINIFQVTKAEKKFQKKKTERKRKSNWYEELHQVTLPAHQATATEKVILYSDTSSKSVSQKFRT